MAQANSGAVRHLPAGLCLLALLACSLSLSYQAAQLWRLLQEPAEHAHAPPAVPPRVVDRQQLAMLFPALPPEHAGSAPVTSLQLTLVAVFRNPNQQRSSAIIRQHGQTAQRVAVGASIAPGIKLHSVDQHYITLDRQGRRESLHFPDRNRQPLLHATDAPGQVIAPQPESMKALAGR
ncbi:type II secretion system protein N [Ectopseudomonas alcaliphila]|uniref:General secretion pathway protein C n=1 Tax=Ectopseudomonas alcaliphila TaxID=101564 RepID=A0A1G7HUK8_9GAMM|nr:type II secretion system protein N [Pseudomonas alcaliphila]MDX5993647.1 type II secretion system protein N [Pseudomonas alcaliphila]SDF04207.1 general secretion pathway protein C [Pseudomonas alcaliphila]